MTPIRTLLHPTDFSESSAAAFEYACALARDYGAKLVVLYAYPPPVNEAEAVDRQRTGGSTEDVMAKVREVKPADPKITVEYRIGEGDPADVILRTAAGEAYDAIVMGTHGRSGIRRVLMGSVAEEVSRKARCPVVTVRHGTAARGGESSADPGREVTIPAGAHALRGTFRVPPRPAGVVIFAHGSGSSRQSPRNQFLAAALAADGFATVLMDLLETSEAENRAKVFDPGLLAARLSAAVAWVGTQPETKGLPVGLFGASTGSAAVLKAAATRPEAYFALVSRGGRPDLVSECLSAVTVPTLLIVGGADTDVKRMNEEALADLAGPKRLAVVPGASHLFPEPGALEEVARFAGEWYRHYLPARAG